MKTISKKDFDAVKSMRKGRDRIALDIQGKSPKELLAYFKLRKKSR